MKSPLSYPGGKSRAIKSILPYIPIQPSLFSSYYITELCSPFFGGGSVELACAAAGVKVYGYDGFEPLINFWEVLLTEPEKLAIEVKKYFPLNSQEFCYLKNNFFNLSDGSSLNMAAVFFVLNKSSFSGVTFSGGGMAVNHPRFTEAAIERLRQFRIDNLYVGCMDFRESIKKHADCFLYLDPPYAIEPNLYGYRGSTHKNFPHEELAALLLKRQNWALSYNDCPMVRELYSGFEFVRLEWAYGMGKNKKSNEVLILS